MERIIALYKSQYFISLIPTILSLVCLIISIKKRKRFPDLLFFSVYAASYFLMDPLLILLYLLGVSPQISNRIFENWDNLFTLLELIIYVDFFNRLLYKKQKKIINTATAIFSLFFLIFTIKGNLHGPLTHSSKNFIYTIQSIILLIPCIFYYINLFSNIPTLQLKNEPSFWITTGLSCMLIGILPFSLAERYLSEHYWQNLLALFGIDSILYGLNFAMIIRAYLSNRQLKSSS